jgi:hypothetical protein
MLCLLANRVVLALDSFSMEGGTIDKEPLQEARKFMEDALYGMDLVNKLKLDARAVETSRKYGRALRVMKDIRTQGNEKEEKAHDLAAALEHYVDSIDHLLGSSEGDIEKVDSKKVEEVKSFFEVLRDVTLEETAGPIEKVSGL